MAGERYAYLRLHVFDPQEGEEIQIWLAGAYRTFTARMVGPYDPLPVGEFPIYTGQNDIGYTNAVYLYNAIDRLLADIGESDRYTLSVFNGRPYLFGVVTITANEYDPTSDFEPTIANGVPPYIAFYENERLSTIKPVFVTYQVVGCLCYGDSTGIIDVTVSNGTNGVYTYLWADGPTVLDRPAVRAGNYRLTVTDSSGASTTVNIQVGQEPQLNVVLNKQDNDLSLVVSGGVAPYTYLWNDGNTSAARTGVPGTTYSCTVTDANGCTASVSTSIATYQYYWSKNPVVLRLDAGDDYRADPTTKPNLSFICQVWIETDYLSDEFVQVGSDLEQPADRSGRTEFEVQILLDSYLREHLPALNQRGITRADSLFRRFYFAYAERFGTPPVTGPYQVREQNYVVLGGLDFFEAAARTWFNTYQTSVKPFLTWEPNSKRVLAEQPEYLYFMVNSLGLAKIVQQVRVTFADGSTSNFALGEVATPKRYEVYCLPAGYVGLNLQRFLKRVAAWEVWVAAANGGVLSEVRRYVLDERFFEFKRFFLYSNSLGGTSTLACVGEAKRTLTPVQDEAQRSLPPAYDPLQGDTMVLDRSATDVLNVATGQLTRTSQRVAVDFLLSRRVTLQRDGLYWPGVVKAKATEIDNDGDTVRTLEFDFQMPSQRLFTPRLPALSASLTRPVAGGEGAQP